MFYLYILKSKKDNQLYIGYTSNLRIRFRQHSEGESRSTKWRRPFVLIYYEAYTDRRDALKREKNLKLRSRAYAQLKKRINNSLLTIGVRGRR